MILKKLGSKVLAFGLAVCMVIGMLPMNVDAAQDTSTGSTTKNVEKVKNYAAQMRKNNTKTDYSTGGFTWDTERKKDSWRYFNGVMVDAFLMEGDTTFADAFYNSNINDDGNIKNKYITGELDSVPTARGLFDLLDSKSNAEKYKKAIQYVYTQLEGQVTYNSCGGNYLHKQDTSGNPTSGWETWNIGLDGLYMAEPFLMECANAIDRDELTLTDKSNNTVSSADIYSAVYARFSWVAENMYDSTTGLYHHGWNVSGNVGNGHFWGRGIGWYAMALVDVIDMMPAKYQEQMKPYLTKLFDGMLSYQDADTGMWYNVVNRGTDLSENILETSVSSMMAYSLMKAYNKGYVTDSKYGQAGLAAFNGVVTNKVSGSEGSYVVANTYLKSGVGTTDEYYTDNGYTVDEAKGTGALIMAATQAQATAEALNGATEPEQPSDSKGSVSASGSLLGSTTYQLVTNGTIEDGAEYLIVNTASNGIGYALRNQNSSSAASQAVTISNNVATIAADESNCVWKFIKDGNGYVISNGSHYIRLNKSSYISTSSSVTTVTSNGNNIFWLKNSEYYLRYSNGKFERSNSENNTSRRNLYLFKKTVVSGDSVTLSVTPGSASLKSGETAKLTASVLVENGDATSSTISWSSSNSAVAAVSDNGVVTAVSDGTATIIATLTNANGRTPTGTVKVEIPVTVTSKTVTSANLTGNDAVTTRKGVEPDFSNVKLNVTYDDNSTDVITTANGLVISGYDVNEIGVCYATVTYQGKEYGTIKVTVEGNPYEGLEGAAEYPEYPADGAVRIDKTATGQNFNSTGVVQVELDTAGISVKQGVDVVLVVDVSNSMAWSLENAAGDGTGDASKLPSKGQNTKLDNAMDAADSFSKILLEGNTGADSDNSVSFVTFAGYDKDHYNASSGKNDEKNYVDSVMTVFTNVKDYNKAATSFAGTSVTGTANGTGATYNLKIVNENGKTLVNGGNRGNTNYDYAFWQAQQAVEDLQGQYANYSNSGRTTYVIFMTDGAPSHYNNQNCNGGSGRDYLPNSSSSTYSLGYTTSNWTEYITGNDNTYANTLYQKVDGNFYAFGFDLANGGFSDYVANEETLTRVLAGMVTGATIPVMATSDKDKLTEFYESLANQIKYAGTKAKVTDIVDSNFTLQTTSFGTDTPTPSAITVTAYDLYTKAETSDNSLIGTRKGTSTPLEKVTFNEVGTEAYSDKLSGNIMSTETDGSVTITAQYFTYTKDAAGVEKFVWNIGDITDKEVALSYYAYLKGSMDGTCAEGVYYTNEGATLEYVDINGKHAVKEFPKPAVAWGGASTSFEYYLVNYKGEPVNRAGEVVPFANRIVLYGDTVALNLNQDVTIPAQSINAATYLPEGYFLYDVNAYYTVNTASSNEFEHGITISEPSKDAKKTTGEGSAQVTQTGAQTTIVVSADEETYIQSRVAFGVRWDLTPIILEYELFKDQIVIDYGKSIQKNVLENDTAIPSGYTGTLAGFTAYNSKTNLKQAQQSAGSTEYTTANGTYTIVDNKVNFQPKQLLSQVEKVFCVVKVTKNDDTSNYYYLYEELDIIPATVMYYETDFADGVFTLTDGAANKWSTKQDTGYKEDEVQDDGTIGMNQTYGFDSTYTDDAVYSNGTSLMVEGEKNSDKVVVTKAGFSFTGTGFDLISRTGAKQGLIQVKIYASNNAANPVKTVKVLNKSESNLELYQIPVVSVNDLDYGTYNVTIDVYEQINSYTGNMESLNRGGEFYFDALRIYNPINVSGENLTGDAAIAQNAYAADGEMNANVFEVRQKIIEKKTYDDGSSVVENSVVFVDRTPAGVEVADYTTIGPNNEVYLSKDQGIAFKLNSTEVPASIDVGAKSADGKPVTLNASLYSLDDAYSAYISEDITSCTAQFYNLMAKAEVTTSEILSGGGAYVVIFNDGEGVLSITDFKVAYGNVPGTASIGVDSRTVEVAGSAGNGGSQEEPNYDILSASFDTATCKLRKNATMTVVTNDVVKSLKVTDKKNREVNADITSTTENGKTTWKVSIKITVAGNQTYTVTGYSPSGTAGAPASATINVTRK